MHVELAKRQLGQAEQGAIIDMIKRFEPFHSPEEIDHLPGAVPYPAEGADNAPGAAPHH